MADWGKLAKWSDFGATGVAVLWNGYMGVLLFGMANQSVKEMLGPLGFFYGTLCFLTALAVLVNYVYQKLSK